MKYKYRVFKTDLVALCDTANEVGKRGGRVVSCFAAADPTKSFTKVILLVEYPV